VIYSKPDFDVFTYKVFKKSNKFIGTRRWYFCLFDVIREWRHFEQVDVRADLEDASWLQEQSEGLYADWKQMGLNEVYPYPEDNQATSCLQQHPGFIPVN
jgi:hypothetical protein